MISYNSRAGSRSVLHHTPKASVTNDDPFRFRAHYLLSYSGHLPLAAANRINRSQKIVDQETARRFERE